MYSGLELTLFVSQAREKASKKASSKNGKLLFLSVCCFSLSDRMSLQILKSLRRRVLMNEVGMNLRES